jgi:hypothetical protein
MAEVCVLHPYTQLFGYIYIYIYVYIKTSVIARWNDLSEAPVESYKMFKMYVTIPRSLRVCIWNYFSVKKAAQPRFQPEAEGGRFQNKCHNGIPVHVCREISNNSM